MVRWPWFTSMRELCANGGDARVVLQANLAGVLRGQVGGESVQCPVVVEQLVLGRCASMQGQRGASVTQFGRDHQLVEGSRQREATLMVEGAPPDRFRQLEIGCDGAFDDLAPGPPGLALVLQEIENRL